MVKVIEVNAGLGDQKIRLGSGFRLDEVDRVPLLRHLEAAVYFLKVGGVSDGDSVAAVIRAFKVTQDSLRRTRMV